MEERFFSEDIERGVAPLLYDIDYRDGIFTLQVRSEILTVIVGRKRFTESLPEFSQQYPIEVLEGGWSVLKFPITSETLEHHAQVLALILSALEFPPDYSRLFEQYSGEGLLQERLITGISPHSVQVTFSPALRKILLERYPNREEERKKLEESARELWRIAINEKGQLVEGERIDGIRVSFTQEGTVYLLAPGNSCGLGVDGLTPSDPNGGFTLAPHNQDTPAQMLTHLVYIALLGR